MTAELTFEVLGPVRAWHGDAELDLGSPQQRAVLVVLLLSQGRHVSMDGLIDALWGQDPPGAATGTVRTYVSRLRRLLDPVTGNRATEMVTSIGDGYALRLGAATVDLDLFSQRAHDARQARRNNAPALAARLLTEALALWQGAPLAGIQGPYADSQRARLTEMRTAAAEERLAMDIESGRHLEAVAELRLLLDEHPLRERLSELLMLALCRSGRQADALAVYAGTLRLLRDELGIDPGLSLSAMHQRILRSDSSLAGEPQPVQPGQPDQPGASQAGSSWAAGSQGQGHSDRPPAQLPPPLPDFSGRAEALAEITGALTGPAGQSFVAIGGMPGAGKTSLALQACHAVLGEFPAGQLYADLAASGGGPVDPADVLRRVLATLGPGPSPGSTDELAPACRAKIAGRRVLVVLDGACDGDQVRRLLPAFRGCAVVITAQRRLMGLTRVRWLEIGSLRQDEAMALLESVTGLERVAAERDAAERLVTACAGQPMALRAAAAHLVARPGWGIGAMLRELEQELHLPEARHADCAVVAAPYETAYRQLTAEQALAFRQAAMHDSPEVTIDAVVARTGLSDDTAHTLLESLADAYLIEAGSYRSYRYNTLVWLYARRKARAAGRVN
jgi:DNA-binding SARP family transcriptional activator